MAKFKVGEFIKRQGKFPKTVLGVGAVKYFLLDPDGSEELFDIEAIDFYYEVSPTEITITREKLAEAWDSTSLKGISAAEVSVVFKTFCKELGL